MAEELRLSDVVAGPRRRVELGGRWYEVPRPEDQPIKMELVLRELEARLQAAIARGADGAEDRVAALFAQVRAIIPDVDPVALDTLTIGQLSELMRFVWRSGVGQDENPPMPAEGK